MARRADAMGVWLVLHCWLVIAGALGLFAVWPNPLTFVFAVVVIGSRQLGLAILMHEATHVALFKTRAINEFAGEWLCGRPIMAELAAYRRYHLTHHRFTQTDKDPNLALSVKFPAPHASIQRKFIRGLTGQTGVKLFIAQIMTAVRLAGDDEAIEAAKTVAAQALNRPIWSSHWLSLVASHWP